MFDKPTHIGSRHQPTLDSHRQTVYNGLCMRICAFKMEKMI